MSFPVLTSPRLRAGASILWAALVLAACGGKSGKNEAEAQGGAGQSSGGVSAAGNDSSGGTSALGGSADAGTSSAAGGIVSGSGGASSAMNCAKVTCPAIPNSCKEVVQDPGECCPTCTDSGCGECALIKCAAGTHSETLAGDCCPSCVADPPDPCLKGQSSYAELRAQMLEKYSSTGCKNSSDCTLIVENTACDFVCNTALPSTLASSFTSNLENVAMSSCATCSAPEPVPCVALLPACVNGKCVGAPPR